MRQTLTGANFGVPDLTKFYLSTKAFAVIGPMRITKTEFNQIDFGTEESTIPLASGADLTGANLRGAILTLANLTEVDFTEADLTGANLNRAILPTQS